MLHNLRCSLLVASTHQDGALLHTPGHVSPSNPQEGVHSDGPGAGGGAELLAAGSSINTVVAATQQEIIQGVVLPPQHQPRQLARGGGGGEEHLRGVVSQSIIIAARYQDGCN